MPHLFLGEPRPLTSETPCDLCGTGTAYLGTVASPARLRAVVCSECGLIFVSPQPTTAELDHFNLNNREDKGSLASAPTGFLDERDVRAEESVVPWSLNVINRFVGAQGKRILSLRCLSGALSAKLEASGAEVYGIDPFDANISYARRVRGLAAMSTIPMSKFHELDLPWDGGFDIVEGLTVHTLAHVLQPRFLLSRIMSLLKPGGFLFLDEKDVFCPTADFDDFILDTGRPHQFHFTRQTLTDYIRSVGFHLLECELDQDRFSAMRHVRVVAQKPRAGESLPKLQSARATGPVGIEVLRRLQRLERTAWFRQRRHELNHTTRGMLRRIPGLAATVRGTQQLFRGER